MVTWQKMQKSYKPLPTLWEGLVNPYCEIGTFVSSHFEVESDKRVEDWPLMQSVIPVLVLCIVYLFMVHYIPIFMVHRKPIFLKHVVLLHHGCLLAAYVYLFREILASTLLDSSFDSFCASPVHLTTYNSLRLITACWLFFILMLIKLFDTVFLAIEKRNIYITYLHVYHRVTVVIWWWIASRYLAEGVTYFSALLYSAYLIIFHAQNFIGLLIPAVSSAVNWSISFFIPKLQLLVVVVIIQHTASAIYLNCGYPKGGMTTDNAAAWLPQLMGTDASDARLNGWFLMDSFWPTFIATAAYLVIVWLGPKVMANRQAWNLKAFIIGYNFGLVMLSLYMFLEIFTVTILNKNFNGLACAPVDHSEDQKSLRLAKVLWWYYFSKSIEFLETFVFILRKKNNQISFLHVYHHSTMFVLWWLTVRHTPGGSAYFPAMCNCAVHTLMYTYYLMSAMGEHMQKYLWWKKYLTKIQLVQFFVVITHISYTIYAQCGFPLGYAWTLLVYMITQIALFSNFYRKAYSKANKLQSSTKSTGDHTNGDYSTYGNGYNKKN